MKKINYIGTIFVFGLTFGIINWYEVLRGTTNITLVDEALFQDMTTNLALIVGALAATLFAIISYKVDRFEENELLKDFVLENLKEIEKGKLLELDDYQRNCFYQVYKNSFSKEMNAKYGAYIENSKNRINQQRKLKKVSSIITCLLICISLLPTFQDYASAQELYDQQVAQAEAEYNTIIEDQILYYDGLPPINLVSGSTFKKGEVEEYIDNCIRTQPQFLLNRCEMINLMSEEQFTITKTQEELDNAYAFASSEDLNIYLQLYHYSDGTVAGEWDKNVVSHELSHIFDYSCENEYTYYGVSDNSTWDSLYTQYSQNISDYATTDSQECFADAAAMYVNSPEELKSASMEMFNYINSYYQMY